MGVHDFTVYDIVKRNARVFSGRPAWFEACEEKSLTFAEFKDKTECLATGLQKAGLNKGDRIGALGKNSVEYFLLIAAASALGAIILAINWRLSRDEIKYNLEDCEPKVLFVDQEFQESCQWLKRDCAFIRKYFHLRGDKVFPPDFESLLENSGDFEMPELTTDDGLIIIHSAAVSGRPKGALLSHGNIISTETQLGYQLQITPQDVHLNLLPLFHVGGLTMAWMAFHAGCLNVNVSSFDPAQTVQLIEDKRVSVFCEFPPVLTAILDQHQAVNADLSCLRAVLGVESAETIERYQRQTGGSFWILYGQTETSSEVTLGRYEDRPGSAGLPMPLTSIRIVDDCDRDVLQGQTGEIIVRGPMVFRGYWNLPADTKSTFRNGWHHTGDLGRFDEDGFLWYAGRKGEKELMKPGGENVYPAEVETIILEHEAVLRAVVFGVPDKKWGEAIVAVCELEAGRQLEAQELIDFVAKHIARYKKPKHVVFVENLPLLDDGSPDRARVKEMYYSSVIPLGSQQR